MNKRFMAIVLVIAYACSGTNQPAVEPSPSAEPNSRAGLFTAAQTVFDSFAAGNYGAVWDRLDADSQDVISRAEYVERLNACPDPLRGIPIEVLNATDNGDGTWSVEVKRGTLETLPAKYERGRWVFPFTAEARQAMSEPAQPC